MKYSINFERDYLFYLNNINTFTFCGTLNTKHKAVFNENGKTAKEVFFMIESQGQNKPTCEPELLDKLLLCKASVNFHIKMWAEGCADGTLPDNEVFGDGLETLEWVNNEPVYVKSLSKRYGFPDWVLTAIYKQRNKILKKKYNGT